MILFSGVYFSLQCSKLEFRTTKCLL
jgi:hypothetical protein